MNVPGSPSVQPLVTLFETGELVRPSADALNFVDLVRAMATLGGATGIELGPGVDELRRLIGEADHYVFVLVDGMGLELLSRLPADSFLRGRVAAVLQSVFLSTTSAAVTSLATGLWPADHGVPAWWMRLPERGLSLLPLPFVERASGEDLGGVGVSPAEVFPAPSIWGRLSHGVTNVLPGALPDSTFSVYASGGTARVGRGDLADAIAVTVRAVSGAERPSFTYAYFHDLDLAAHVHGAGSAQSAEVLADLDSLLSRLAGELPAGARLIISADHGEVDVPHARRFIVAEADPLGRLLVCLPTGEPRVPIFHVRDGAEAEFASLFRERLGEHFALLVPDEVEALRLMGPGPLHPVMRARLGSFMGVPLGLSKVYFEPIDGHPEFIGMHGGLSAAEMRIPLILA